MKYICKKESGRCLFGLWYECVKMRQSWILRVVVQGFQKPMQANAVQNIANRQMSHKPRFAPIIDLDFNRIEEYDVSIVMEFTFTSYNSMNQ